MEPTPSLQERGRFSLIPRTLSRVVGLSICALPLIITGMILTVAMGSHDHLLVMQGLIGLFIVVGLAWLSVRAPITVIGLCIMTGLIWWAWSVGWTPMAWSFESESSITARDPVSPQRK